MCVDAYATFRHEAVVPLVQIGHRQWLAELFHGPTLAFKDVALQLVGRLFDHVLAERSERITIIGATSGDTGSAAIEAVRHCDRVDIVVLYPEGGPSDVQRRQMTTVDSPNVRAVAVDGTFDDCQDLVKAMFNDAPFRDRMRLSAVNSINWARVMAQIVYYVTARPTPCAEPITACVPTGNFGNILAGWVAQHRARRSPTSSWPPTPTTSSPASSTTATCRSRGVVPTTSPSMDIQVSSNFERLLFEMNDRSGWRTAEQLLRFREVGRLDVAEAVRDEWIDGRFRAARFGDDAVAPRSRRVYAASGVLVDPHTATGTAAAHALAGDHPVVTMATAHPAKFPDVVVPATGVRPALPEHLADLFERPERFHEVPDDLAAVEDFVELAFGR